MAKLEGPPIAPVEAALTVIGLKPVLSRKIDFITRGQIKQMVALPKTLRTFARKLVKNKLGGSYHEAIDYRAMLKDLAREWDINQVREMADSFPPDLRATGAALIISSSAIVRDLLQSYPVSTYQTVTGSANLLPSDSRLWKFISKLEVISDPTVIFPLMATGALLVSQAKALRATYPTIAAYIDWAILVETIKAKTARKSFELSPRAEIGVRAWMGRGPIDPKLLQLAQGNAVRAKGRKARPPSAQPRPQDDQTQAQRALTT